MILFFKRCVECSVLMLWLPAVPVIVGCQGFSSGELPDPGLSPHAAKVAEKDSAPSEALGGFPSSSVSAADRAVLARGVDKDSKGRGRSVWIQAVDPTAEFHWHYPNLEEILARPAEDRPDLHALLSDSDPIVCANAALALARTGECGAKERLVEVVRSPEMAVPMRCAAIESLAHLQDAQAVESLKKLLDQYGRYGKGAKSPYIPELHAELIRGLARHIQPTDNSPFIEALRSPHAAVRLEALKAWAASKQGALPIEAVDLRADGDYRVRAAALRAIAAKRHPQAMEYLAAGLLDSDVRVREAAIAALGTLGGNDALARLQKLVKDPHESIRAQAVAALAAAKAEQPVLQAADDQSWRVRQKVAEALASFCDREAASTANRLLDDPSAEVQLDVVRALDAWTLEQSGPILLAAMSKPAFVTRKAAATQLRDKWPPAAEFPVEGPAQRRAEVLNKLQRSFHEQFSAISLTSQWRAVPPKQTVQKASAAQVAEVELLLRRGDFKALDKYNAVLVDALEQLRLDRKLLLPERLYHDVLPRYEPVFAVLDRLSASNVMERRRAAGELAELSGKQPFGRLAMARLAQLMAAETDALVWQSALRAAADNGSQQAAELAYTGLGHASAEVRRLACEHLAEHPDPRHQQALIPALDDKSQDVVCAAARALAASGNMADAQPLRNLLGSSNEEIQLQAARALAEMNDPAGKPALQRLANSRDPKIRAKAARAMGDFPDPEFTAILIQLLNDNLTVARAALDSLPKVVGKDIVADSGQSPANTTEQMLRWKRWHQGQSPP